MANTTVATSEKIRIRLKAYDHVVFPPLIYILFVTTSIAVKITVAS